MRRTGIKTGIRIAAIALIAFPEPVTTALGILILCATIALRRQKSLNKFGDLEVLVKRSLQNAEPPPLCNSWFDNPRLDETVLHHTLKTSFPQYEAVPEFIQRAISKRPV